MIRTIPSSCLFLCLCLVSSIATAAEAPAPPPSEPTPARLELSWEKTDTSLALLNHHKVVWRHVHDKTIGKPYMRIGLLDGTELTRPYPIPQDYAKADHPWHRALWWSFKAINGKNYWEENQQGTEPVAVKITEQEDGAARIDLEIAYHLPDQPPVVSERRVIRMGKPSATGTYLIDWQATFTPAGKEDVVFNQNSYGGFAIRLAAEFCGDNPKKVAAWKFSQSDGDAVGDTHHARWMAYQGSTRNGQPAALVMFAHPDNPRYPAWWQSRNQYPYLNPSLTCKEDYRLAAGKSLTLRYGVLVHQGGLDHEEIEHAFQAFAESKGANAAAD